MPESEPVRCKEPGCTATIDRPSPEKGGITVVANRSLRARTHEVFYLECEYGHQHRYQLELG